MVWAVLLLLVWIGALVYAVRLRGRYSISLGAFVVAAQSVALALGLYSLDNPTRFVPTYLSVYMLGLGSMMFNFNLEVRDPRFRLRGPGPLYLLPILALPIAYPALRVLFGNMTSGDAIWVVVWAVLGSGLLLFDISEARRAAQTSVA